MNANRKLLQDILNDASEPVRQEVLAESLRELRRRKRRSRIRRAWPLALAALLVLSVWLAFLAMGHRAGKLAHTQPDEAQSSIAVAYAPIEVVTNHWPAIDVVESGHYQTLVVDNSTYPLDILDDAALLSEFPDKAVGLIPGERGLVQFVFLNPQHTILRY